MRNTYLTKQGFEKVGAELEQIINVTYPKSEKEYKETVSYGLPTNDPYRKDAKEKRDFFKKRIAVLTEMLDTAKLIGG